MVIRLWRRSELAVVGCSAVQSLTASKECLCSLATSSFRESFSRSRAGTNHAASSDFAAFLLPQITYMAPGCGSELLSRPISLDNMDLFGSMWLDPPHLLPRQKEISGQIGSPLRSFFVNASAAWLEGLQHLVAEVSTGRASIGELSTARQKPDKCATTMTGSHASQKLIPVR